jgi:hypothetical protein
MKLKDYDLTDPNIIKNTFMNFAQIIEYLMYNLLNIYIKKINDCESNFDLLETSFEIEQIRNLAYNSLIGIRCDDLLTKDFNLEVNRKIFRNKILQSPIFQKQDNFEDINPNVKVFLKEMWKISKINLFDYFKVIGILHSLIREFALYGRLVEKRLKDKNEESVQFINSLKTKDFVEISVSLGDKKESYDFTSYELSLYTFYYAIESWSDDVIALLNEKMKFLSIYEINDYSPLIKLEEYKV